jgi:bacterioferritin-associated ferredoxin
MDEEIFNQIDNLGELLGPSVKEKLDADVLICECFCVNVQDIRDACSDIGMVDFSLLRNTYGLGSGCQGCLKKASYWSSKIF